MRTLFDKLEKDCCPQDLNREGNCEGLALFLSKLRQLHPFREERTRTIMVMCYHIARQAGYQFSLKLVANRHKNLRDSLVISTLGDIQKLEDFLLLAIGKDDRSKSLWRKILARI